jgi:hypothetical protein
MRELKDTEAIISQRLGSVSTRMKHGDDSDQASLEHQSVDSSAKQMLHYASGITFRYSFNWVFSSFFSGFTRAIFPEFNLKIKPHFSWIANAT